MKAGLRQALTYLAISTNVSTNLYEPCRMNIIWEAKT